MKKNFLISMSVAVIIAFAFAACNDDFLNTPPQASLSGSTLSSSKNGVDATLIGAYKSLIGWTGNWNEAAWGTAPSNWAFQFPVQPINDLYAPINVASTPFLLELSVLPESDA